MRPKRTYCTPASRLCLLQGVQTDLTHPQSWECKENADTSKDRSAATVLSDELTCHRCGEVGHIADSCPEVSGEVRGGYRVLSTRGTHQTRWFVAHFTPADISLNVLCVSPLQLQLWCRRPHLARLR